MDQILKIADVSIYGAIAAVALLGLFWVVLLWFRIGQKRFASSARADLFLNEVRERLAQRDYDGVAELCDSPPYWSKATPQLVLVAMQNLDRPMSKLRRLLAERFEVDVMASLHYGTSWIGTFAKSAPMLGLLGTVVGMIAAFDKIATAQSSGIKPEALASDISFALLTTAFGLMIAIPLVLGGNMIHIRMGKLQDGVQADLGRFLDDLERSAAEANASGKGTTA
jgi:biopolymer transport protein ExbB/TolQ